MGAVIPPKVSLSKNGGSIVGTRPQINLIEGSNVTITEADNSGTNSVDVTIAATSGGLSNIAAYSLLSNNTSSSALPIANQTIVLGTPGFTDTGVLEQLTGTSTGYTQEILQNLSNGTAASTDYVIANDLGSSTTNYGNLGINSSTYTGSGSLNLANATYLLSASGDLTLATTGSNAIHLLTNSSTTDAVTISSAGVVTIPNITSGFVKSSSGVLSSTTITEDIGITIDGGVVAPMAGTYGQRVVDYACTIQSVTLLADVSGSIVFDIKKSTYANFPGTMTSIVASAPPTLSSAQKSQDSTLTGWTTSISAGDVLQFIVSSSSTLTRVNLILKVVRT